MFDDYTGVVLDLEEGQRIGGLATERTHLGGWYSFQPLYDVIAAEHPNLFDEGAVA